MAHDPITALIELVMQRLGVTNARQFSSALGMTDIDRERRVRRWITGENAPSFDYVLLMLSKAGLLMPEAEAAWSGKPVEEARRAAADAAREAEERVARLAREGRARRTRASG